MKNTTQGFLCLIMVVIFWGITWPIMKIGLNYTQLRLAPWEMLIAGIILGVFAFIQEDITDIVPVYPFFAIISFTGLIGTAFCYWAAVLATQHLPAMVSSIGFLGVPVVGLISSILILSEPITLSLSVGLLCIVVGICIMVFGESRTKFIQRSNKLIKPSAIQIIGENTECD